MAQKRVASRVRISPQPNPNEPYNDRTVRPPATMSTPTASMGEGQRPVNRPMSMGTRMTYRLVKNPEIPGDVERRPTVCSAKPAKSRIPMPIPMSQPRRLRRRSLPTLKGASRTAPTPKRRPR